MIAPQELKIENWVYDRSKTRIVKVWGIESNHDQITVNHANGSAIYKVDLKYIEPIELTEEWLLRLGYECNKNEYFISGFDRFNVFQSVKGSYIFCDDKKAVRYVKYVHQLQNLYYCLCGSELII